MKTATEPGRCAEDSADALEVFCSDSLRSIDRTVMRAQVIELILDILATTDVQSDARRRLLQHLASHPGSPEQALLCHLSENACLPPAAGALEAPMESAENQADGPKPKWLPAPLRNLLRLD
ncbi:hypothetical protein R5O87_15695 [Arthrobacter globiformis]